MTLVGVFERDEQADASGATRLGQDEVEEKPTSPDARPLGAHVFAFVGRQRAAAEQLLRDSEVRFQRGGQRLPTALHAFS